MTSLPSLQDSLETLSPFFSSLKERKEAFSALEKIGLPKRKLEGFRYISLDRFLFAPSVSSPLVPPQAPPSITSLSLEEAKHSFSLLLQNRAQARRKKEQDPIALLNETFYQGGHFFYVPPSIQEEKPLVWHTQLTSAHTEVTQIHLYLGQNAHLHLHHRISGKGVGNLLFDCILDEGAKLTFSEVQNTDPSSQIFVSFRSRLKHKASLEGTLLHRGSHLARSSFVIQLEGEESRADLQGLSYLSDQKENHLSIHMEHKAPHARSRQHFKSVLHGKSRYSFQGNIHVEPLAQKTDSYQLTQNLLLGDHVEAFATPNLEIFADDVKASHGATFSRLREEELFYLRSRGLSEHESQKWLVEAFCREILNTVDPHLVGPFPL